MKFKQIYLALIISVSMILGISFSSQPETVTNAAFEEIECEHYWTIEEINGELFLVERDCNDKIVSVIPIYPE
ncbi:hypothetical protein ACFLSV_01865 [Bacteroidota bacterium]